MQRQQIADICITTRLQPIFFRNFMQIFFSLSSFTANVKRKTEKILSELQKIKQFLTPYNDLLSTPELLQISKLCSFYNLGSFVPGG